MKLVRDGYFVFNSETEQTTLDVGKSLGRLINIPTMPLTQTLTPRLKENEFPNTYSGNFGLNEFPLHTDLAHWYIPPRYFLLRCIEPASEVFTHILDRQKVLQGESEEKLSRSHFMPRKTLDRSANLLKLMSGGLFRWDSVFLKPTNKLAEELKQRIEERINSIKPESISLDNPGKCLLIDNWRVLHGRSVVGTNSMNRIFERVYIEELNLDSTKNCP